MFEKTKISNDRSSVHIILLSLIFIIIIFTVALFSFFRFDFDDCEDEEYSISNIDNSNNLLLYFEDDEEFELNCEYLGQVFDLNNEVSQAILSDSDGSSTNVFEKEVGEDISFGESEYECYGSCFCDSTSSERRNGIAASRMLSISVVAISSVFAMNLAKSRFEERCETMMDECTISSIQSEVDECNILFSEFEKDDILDIVSFEYLLDVIVQTFETVIPELEEHCELIRVSDSFPFHTFSTLLKDAEIIILGEIQDSLHLDESCTSVEMENTDEGLSEIVHLPMILERIFEFLRPKKKRKKYKKRTTKAKPKAGTKPKTKKKTKKAKTRTKPKKKKASFWDFFKRKKKSKTKKKSETTYDVDERFGDYRSKVNDVWEKATELWFQKKSVYRKDRYGNIIKRDKHGDRKSKYGWEIEHSVPRCRGGTNHLNNLQPVHWRENLKKGRKTHQEYQRKKSKR